jgi:alpha,alpha-trehalose phosphorylase (configuration-retaining)
MLKINNIKFIAVGLEKSELTQGLGSDLWLRLDIVPHEFKTMQNSWKKKCLALCENVLREFDENNLSLIETNGMNSVKTSRLVELSEYAKFSDRQDFEVLNILAAKCRRDKINIAFFNSTACGGGVALMRHAMIRLYRLLDVNVNWHVMEADEEIFQITKKKFHNILHGVARQEIKLTLQDKKQYNKWIEKNARKFEPIFKNSNVLVIDDPQPSGLIPYIKKVQPQDQDHIPLPH